MFQEDIKKEDNQNVLSTKKRSVLMISTDRKIFEEGSAVRARLFGYAEFLERLDVIVFSTKEHGTPEGEVKISDKITARATNSMSRWWYMYDAVGLGKQTLKLKTQNSKLKNEWVITCQDPFETGYVGMRLKQKFGVPLQLQIHTDFMSPHFAKGFLNKIRLKIANKTLPVADGLRVVSQRIADSLKAENSHLKAEPTVLPVFVDAEKIENSPVIFDLRAKYPQFNKIILVASRLEPEKDIETAIKAFGEVVGSNPKTGLVIVGEGSQEEILKTKVKNQNLTDNVAFEGWQDDLNSYYKGCDIFLNTSLYEGYGMTLIEASLNKKPIVTTDVGIAGEGGALVHTQHALVATVGDFGRIAGYLNSFLKDENGSRATGLRAYTKVSGDMISKETYYKNVTEGWSL